VSRGKVIAGIVVLVVIAAIVGGVLYSSSASAPAVTTGTVTKETLGVIVTASGKVEAATRTDVYPPAAGTLASVEVEDGDAVQAGDTLAVMDSGPLKLQVKQAAAALAGARAQLDAVNKGVPAAIDKSAASAQVSAARASFDAADEAYDAFLDVYQSLPETTQASLEATLTQLSAARKQAYAGLQSARSGASKLSTAAKVSLARASANAAVDSASFALKLAKDTLADAKITSPISGVVIFNATGSPGTDGMLPKAAKGTAVSPGAAPFTVIDFGTLNFNAQVDEADIDKVAPDMKATVVLDAFAGVDFTGTVKVVRSTAIQTTTGGIAFPAIISVDSAGKNLKVGMSGSTDIEVEAVQGALTVPIEAVFDDGGKKYVFVIKADKVTKTEITTGALTDTTAQVLTGVSDGDVVATSQLNTLKDGMAVRVQ